MEGKQYKHRNGNIYTVLFLTNKSDNPDGRNNYPKTVVYVGQNGKLWSRPLSDWDRSFEIANN